MQMQQIVCEFPTAHGVFRDALYLPVDHTYTEAEINEMKQRRLDNWLAIVNAPPPEEEIPLDA
jgi:hypothetical protein